MKLTKYIKLTYAGIALALTVGGTAFAYQAYDYNYGYAYQNPYGTNSRYTTSVDNRYYDDYYYDKVMRDQYTGKYYKYYYDGYVTHYKKADQYTAHDYTYPTYYGNYYSDYTQSRRTTGGPYYEDDLHFDPVTGKYTGDTSYKTPRSKTASTYKNAYTYQPYDRPYYDSRYYDSVYYNDYRYDPTYNSYYDPYTGYTYYY